MGCSKQGRSVDHTKVGTHTKERYTNTERKQKLDIRSKLEDMIIIT